MAQTDLLNKINPEHIGLLTAALRSPSAHNAQPWKIRPLDDHKTYELHYDHNDYLPEDPDDRDAYLTMGAFVETLVLQAPNFDLDIAIEPKLTRSGDDLYVAKVEITKAAQPSERNELNRAVGDRQTNRYPYAKEDIPEALKVKLRELGNTLIEPRALKDVLTEASMKSWDNPRFVHDLHVWYRDDVAAPDGFSSPQMKISKFDTWFLKLAFRLGRLKSRPLQRLYSTRDVAMFTGAPIAAVLGASDMTPASLYDAGRRLLRSWVVVTAAGYNVHPFSIAIDEKSTAPKVAQITGVGVPVALYRIGRATKKPYGSNRKDLASVLID